MKKQLVAYFLVLIAGVISAPALAIEYSIDFLEQGNPGGWSASKKTFDTKEIKTHGKEIEVDLWIKDAAQPCITAGFLITYDSSKVSIVNIEVYDSSVVSGPWDRMMTRKVPDSDGPGTYMVACGNLSNVTPDKGSDIIVAKVRFLCKDKCDTTMKFSPISGFDTVVGGKDGKVYDPHIKPLTVTIR